MKFRLKNWTKATEAELDYAHKIPRGWWYIKQQTNKIWIEKSFYNKHFTKLHKLFYSL